MAIIFLSVGRQVFHIGWNSHYPLFVKNPTRIPIGHGILEDHFGNPYTEAYSSGKSSHRILLSYSGIYNWVFTIGFNTVFDVYNFVITYEFLGVTFIRLGRIHLIYSCQFTPWVTLNKPVEKEIKGTLPSPRLAEEIIRILSKKLGLHIKVHPIFIWPCKFFLAYFEYPFYTGDWVLYSTHINNDDGRKTLRGNSLHTSITWLGGLKSNTISLYLTDIGHHHFAVGVVFLWGGHVYLSLYKGFGHRIRDVFSNNGHHDASILFSPGIREVTKSLHVQVLLPLGGSSLSSCLGGNQLRPLSSLTPYLYLSYDSITYLLVYLHHSSIASFLMIGSFSHGGIFLIRDLPQLPHQLHEKYTHASETPYETTYEIGRILAHKGGIISHLTSICLWLGFHTLGIYIHNDTILAFGEEEKQILIEPVFPQIIQESCGKPLYSRDIVDK